VKILKYSVLASLFSATLFAQPLTPEQEALLDSTLLA